MCRFLCGHKFSTHLGKYQGVWLLDYTVRVCWVFLFVRFGFFWLPLTACGILAPRPGIEPKPAVVKARSFNHGTAREVQSMLVLQETAKLSSKLAVLSPAMRVPAAPHPHQHLVLSALLIFKLDYFFLSCVFYIFQIQVLYRIYDLQIFSPSGELY